MRILVRYLGLTGVSAVVLLALTGCPKMGTGSDTTPPVFGGLSSVTASGMTGATLSWTAATDDQTASAAITYEIWDASVANVPTTSAPIMTTSAGATTAIVTELPAGVTTYFVVRAMDKAGNTDSNTTARSVKPSKGNWAAMDGGLATGINDGLNPGGTAAAVVTGSLYEMWIESGTANVARVKRFNGAGANPLWTAVDGGAGSGVNYVNTHNVAYNFTQHGNGLAAFSNKLYATWAEPNSAGAAQIRVAVYDPANASAGWTYIESATPTETGLNYSSSLNATNPTLAVSGGVLYAVWIESDGTYGQLRAAAYNGNDSSPSWTIVDGDGVEGLNFATGSDASFPTASAVGGRLVVAWGEAGKIRAKAYNGSSWDTSLDGGGLNFDGTQNAEKPSATVAAGKLYLAWDELDANSGVQLIRVRAFNGSFSSPAWTFVDGNNDNGINYDSSQYAYEANLAALNGGLVATWYETNGTYNQIRVRAFNGDVTSPAWVSVDPGTSNGINHDPAYPARDPVAVSLNGSLYVQWEEDSGSSNGQIRVARGN